MSSIHPVKSFMLLLCFAAGIAALTLPPSRAVHLAAYGAAITTRISVASDGTQGNNASIQPAISADGRYIAFASSATNLVSGGTSAGNIFVRDIQTGRTSLVSVASDGSLANGGSTTPTVSADGRYVSFGSMGTNLVSADTNGVCDVFIRDTQME